MAIRTLFVVGLVVLASGLGCAGMSGQRFYEQPTGSTGHELSDIVDCPTCPTGRGGRDAIVHAAPTAAHDDGVTAPHAKFHPVPTRPVFAPKVALASATVEAVPAEPITTPALAVIHDDEAPTPPRLAAVEKQTSTRSVLKKNQPKLLAEDTMTSVLVARKSARPATIEHTAATPVPAPAGISTATPSTSDGWRPRVAN